MTKEVVKLIDEAIVLHMKAIINYEKMKMIANRSTAFMDTKQRKEHKKQMLDIAKKIKEMK